MYRITRESQRGCKCVADAEIRCTGISLLDMGPHPWMYAAGATAVIAAQAMLIGALLTHKRRLRRTEIELRHLEARNAAMLDAIPDLMFLIGTDGVYQDYHAKDPQQLYVPPERFLGKRIVDVMPTALASVFMRELADAQQSAEPRVVEYSLPLNGDVRHFEARLVACERDTVLSMVRDITARKRTEAELAKRESELQQTNARNHDLAGRLIAAQEAERRRVARELHDDLSQKLALLSIDAEQLLARGKAGREPVPLRVREIFDRVSEIASDIHRVSHELHPAKLGAIGLVKSLEALCRDASLQHRIAVDFMAGDVPMGVNADVSLCFYRVTQEALHNVTKHSGARCALVRIMCEGDALMLQIADHGVGFVVRDVDRMGLGLVSMRKRVSFVGGDFAIHSAPEHGTRIGVRVPLSVALSVVSQQAAGSA
jgi:signal transduction histidine kinase